MLLIGAGIVALGVAVVVSMGNPFRPADVRIAVPTLGQPAKSAVNLAAGTRLTFAVYADEATICSRHDALSGAALRTATQRRYAWQRQLAPAATLGDGAPSSAGEATIHIASGGSTAMDCEILRTLYLKSNGEVLCNDDFGERMRLGVVEADDPSWSIARLFDSEQYQTIRRALSHDQIPWDGICQRCAFLRRGLPMQDSLTERKIEKFQIEPSLACNLCCPGCSNQEQRRVRKKPHVMPLRVFQSVLRSLHDADYDVKWIEYCGQGEPLTNPEFADFVALARRLLPHAGQRLITNANFDYGEVMRGQALDEIYVACDGVRQQSYEQYRQKGDVTKALRFMRDAPARVEGREQRVLWKYILFEFNDSLEELLEAVHTANQLDVDTLQFTITHSKHRSRAFALEQAGVVPIAKPAVMVEPCAAFYEGAKYGRRLSTVFLSSERRPAAASALASPHRGEFWAHLDEVVLFAGGALAVRGWAAATSELTHVRVFCDGQLLGTSRLGIHRKDVHLEHPGFRRQRSGFYLSAQAPASPRSPCAIAVDLLCNDKGIGRMAETYSFD